MRDETAGGRWLFYREKRSRGRRAWTNDQPGHEMPLGGVGRGGGTSPLTALSHHASRGSGYKTLERPRDVTLRFEFSLCYFCQLVRVKNVQNEKTLGLPVQ